MRWNTNQGEIQGKVVKRATRAFKLKGHKVAASTDNPEYIVEVLRAANTPPTRPAP